MPTVLKVYFYSSSNIHSFFLSIASSDLIISQLVNDFFPRFYVYSTIGLSIQQSSFPKLSTTQSIVKLNQTA